MNDHSNNYSKVTKQKWIAMWRVANEMEHEAHRLQNTVTRQRILNYVDKIKSHIHAVIGDVE